MRPTQLSLSSQTYTAPVPLDYKVPVSISVDFPTSGTLTYSVQYTNDNIYAKDYNPATGTWVNFPEATSLTAATTFLTSFFCRAVRLNVSSYSSGTVRMTVSESFLYQETYTVDRLIDSLSSNSELQTAVYEAAVDGGFSNAQVAAAANLGAKLYFVAPSGDETGDEDTAAIQAVIDSAELQIPAENVTWSPTAGVVLAGGEYYINDELRIKKGISFTSMPGALSAILYAVGDGTGKFVIRVEPDTIQINGAKVCNLVVDGASKSWGGLKVKAEAPLVVWNSVFDSLYLKAVRTGVDSRGTSASEVYKNRFTNIAVQGHGAYGVVSEHASYNVWDGIIITDPASASYAAYLSESGTSVRNMTTEQVVFLNLPGGSVDSLIVEGINAATAGNPVVVNINSASYAANIGLTSIPNAKADYGVTLGSAITLMGLRITGTDGPHYPVNLADNCVLINCTVSTTHFKLDQYETAAHMGSCRFINSPDLIQTGGDVVPTVGAASGLPTAAAALRGVMVRTTDSNVDALSICMQTGASTYAWKTVTLA